MSSFFKVLAGVFVGFYLGLFYFHSLLKGNDKDIETNLKIAKVSTCTIVSELFVPPNGSPHCLFDDKDRLVLSITNRGEEMYFDINTSERVK